jgi:hypothetical protein
MCEIRYYRCTCGEKWRAHHKLSSCKDPDPAIKCPESLCMYVGSYRTAEEAECDTCCELREALEALDDPEAGKVEDETTTS